jgi:hypothetical protein
MKSAITLAPAMLTDHARMIARAGAADRREHAPMVANLTRTAHQRLPKVVPVLRIAALTSYRRAVTGGSSVTVYMRIYEIL